MKRLLRICVCLCAVFLLAEQSPAWSASLMMATTTSTEDTGLLPVLAAAYQKKTGVELRWVAVGSGKALELGKNCDADILMVHAPQAEEAFMEQGNGLFRTQLMYNDFVLVGPEADPARVKGKSVAEALAGVAAAKAVFVSRGDKSGTHMAELALWKNAGMETPDKDPWYVSTGQGMLQCLRMASEKGGYCLADRGTFAKYASAESGRLSILVEGDAALRNQYSLIVLQSARCPHAKQDLAEAFATWMVSPEGQQVIADFKVGGKQLFFPNAAK